MNYYQKIKERYSNLTSSEKDIKKWQRQGFKALKEKKPEKAESSFEKLAVARPWQHTGFEGLAYVYYKSGRFKEAEWFMMKAVSIAETLVKKELIERKVVDLMHRNLNAIREESPLFRWWERIDWERNPDQE